MWEMRPSSFASSRGSNANQDRKTVRYSIVKARLKWMRGTNSSLKSPCGI